MAYVLMDSLVMAYIVMAYVVMAYIVSGCEENQQQRRYIMIGAFVCLFNLLLFCGGLDIVVAVLSVISTLQTFRAIGMMGSVNLPDAIKDFYAWLAVFTMDFEFGVPGCGTAYTIIRYYY